MLPGSGDDLVLTAFRDRSNRMNQRQNKTKRGRHFKNNNLTDYGGKKQGNRFIPESTKLCVKWPSMPLQWMIA